MSTTDYDQSPYLDLTNPVEYDDYTAYMIDALTRVDTYKNLTSVAIKVVSPPIPVNPGILPKLPGELNTAIVSEGVNMSQVMFRGRIQGDTFISTHQLLEDPCNPTKVLGDDAALSQLINAHLLCISKYDSVMAGLRIGDIVNANIGIGQSGPMDVQFCYIESVEQVLSNEAVAASSTTDQCMSAKKLFNTPGTFGGIIPGNNYTPNPDASRYLLNTGPEQDPAKWDSVTLHSTVTTSVADTIYIARMRGISYHYWVRRDGSIVEAASPDYLAWHAGTKNGPACNYFSIGIGLINLAYTKQFAGTAYTSAGANSMREEYSELQDPPRMPPIEEWKSYDSSTPDKKWEPIPAAQVQGLISLVNLLKAQYPNITTYYSHEDVREAGKEDPGPAFDRHRKTFENGTGLRQDPRFPRSTKNRDQYAASSTEESPTATSDLEEFEESETHEDD